MTSASANSKHAPRRPNPKGAGSRLREELLEAAARVVSRDGHTGITLRAVAREAKVSAPAIYLQFADRETLVLALVERTWRELASLMQVADQQAGADGAFAQLQAQLLAYVDYASSNPMHYELLFGVSPKAHAIAPRDALTAPVYWTLEAAVTRCRAEGHQLPLPTAEQAYEPNAVLLFVIAHGFIALARTAQIHPTSSQQGIRDFVAHCLNTLVVRPADGCVS